MRQLQFPCCFWHQMWARQNNNAQRPIFSRGFKLLELCYAFTEEGHGVCCRACPSTAPVCPKKNARYVAKAPEPAVKIKQSSTAAICLVSHASQGGQNRTSHGDGTDTALPRLSVVSTTCHGHQPSGTSSAPSLQVKLRTQWHCHRNHRRPHHLPPLLAQVR